MWRDLPRSAEDSTKLADTTPVILAGLSVGPHSQIRPKGAPRNGKRNKLRPAPSRPARSELGSTTAGFFSQDLAAAAPLITQCRVTSVTSLLSEFPVRKHHTKN